MRLYIVIFFNLISLSSFASSSNFSFDEVATKLGLDVVSIGKPFTFPGVHYFYTDANFSRAMMVVENIKGRRSKLKASYFPNYTLIEYPVTNSTFTSVVVINITRAQLETYVSPLESNMQMKLDRFLSLFITKAHATETCDENPLENLSGSSLVDLSDFYSTSYFQIASGCLMGVLEGAWETTGGKVQSFYKALKQLATNPRAFWDEKVEAFRKMKDFFMEFETNMQRTLTSFKTMPNETKAQLLCSFVGSIGTDLVIAALTAGATSPKFLASLEAFTSKFLKIENFMAKLNRIGKLKDIPSKFFNDVMKGLITDKRLSAIQTLTRHDFDDLALQLVNCSL